MWCSRRGRPLCSKWALQHHYNRHTQGTGKANIALRECREKLVRIDIETPNQDTVPLPFVEAIILCRCLRNTEKKHTQRNLISDLDPFQDSCRQLSTSGDLQQNFHQHVHHAMWDPEEPWAGTEQGWAGTEQPQEAVPALPSCLTQAGDTASWDWDWPSQPS